MRILSVEPTVFFIQKGTVLLQLVRVSVSGSAGIASCRMCLRLSAQDLGETIPLEATALGETQYEVWFPDLREPREIRLSLAVDGQVHDERTLTWQPQRHWDVYIVHGSHHDLGYTDLPSNVMREHDGYMDQVLAYCAETADWPQDSQFRYVAEQAWSVLHYIEHRSPEVVDQLVRLMREKRIEVTALLDNETSELCAHEEQIRLLYPAFRLKRRFGIPIHTAELNDIPGVSWGLVSVLAGSGVRYFAPAIQDYFSWGVKVHPHWDEEAVLPRDMVGAFWWEGPDGSRVLFWYGGGKVEGPWLWTYEQAVRELPDYLLDLERRGYDHDLVRLKFLGGKRDNSPPDIRLCRIAREWNRRWTYPRLIVSTNVQFFEQFEKTAGDQLRVLRGDLPNTDYPIGALSRAKELGINRLTHSALASAEKLAACAALVADYDYPANTLAEAYESILFYDGHTGGMAHPIGPAQEASWSQKSESAYRAAALAQDVLVKSTNRVADEVSLAHQGLHIVVFNPLARKRTDLTRVPASPPKPCASPMYWRDPPPDEDGPRELAAGRAIGRRIVNLPLDLLDGSFELIDLSTGASVPYQISTLSGPLAARPLAEQRWALGHVDPHSQESLNFGRGHLKELVFVAEDVPSLGYKTYRLVPTAKPPSFGSSLYVGEHTLENRFYRVELDAMTGAVSRIFDKELQREWVDSDAPHGFDQLVVRTPRTGEVHLPTQSRIERREEGPVLGSLEVSGQGLGCPQRTQEITLYERVKRIDFANRLLKDATPLLELYFAFPFAASEPQFRYEASNAVIEPIRDQLAGTNTDAYTTQHWTAVWDQDGGIAWTSLEAPVIELGGLWPGYVSQAHHGITPPGYGHPFLRDPAQLTKGHIYSYVMVNNFRTAFQVAQVADLLFRYSVTSYEGDWRAGGACDFGSSVATPLEAVCVTGPQAGSLPESGSFCRLDKPNVRLLAMKGAEDGDGLILRLSETAGQDTSVTVELPCMQIDQAFSTNLMEENLGVLAYDRHRVRVLAQANSIVTVRCLGSLSWPQVTWFSRFHG